MSDNDPRDVEVPSVVASIKDPDKYTAFDTMLEVTHFFDTLEAIRTRSGKSKEEFLIVIKPNFMMTIRIENPPVVYTDPELVEYWVKKLREADYTRIRVVEAQNVYNLWYKNRSVNHVATMPAQSTVSWKDAPVEAVASTVICFSFLVGWPKSLVTKDQTEVSPLSR